MTASRAFSLLVWIGAGGIVLLFASGMHLALGAWPNHGNLHRAADGICIIAPVRGDFLSHVLSYGVAILLVSVVGIALHYLGSQSVAYRRVRKEIAGAMPVESYERLHHLLISADISTRVSLLPSSRRIAFTAGLWSPYIVVTTGLIEALTDKQLEAVLLHEEFHCRWRDPLRALVARALGTMLFFLPILRDLAYYYHISKEVDADLATVRQQGTRAHVASALCKLVDSEGLPAMVAVGFNEMTSLEARIEALRTGRWNGTPFGLSTVRWSVAGILLLLALIAHPFIAAHNWGAIALSLAACPAWLLLFWMRQRMVSID